MRVFDTDQAAADWVACHGLDPKEAVYAVIPRSRSQKMKRWLLVASPIGRFLQWAAAPGRRIEEQELVVCLKRIFGEKDQSVPLEPSDDAAEFSTDCEIRSNLKNQNSFAPQKDGGLS